jgi:GAF domain-containing protein
MSAYRGRSGSSSSLADLQEQVTFLARELAEAREQQTATSDVLKMISSSTGELQPLFQEMLANAMRVCEANFGFMNRYDGDTWKIVAIHGGEAAYPQYLQQHGYKRPGPETVVARIARTKETVQVVDLMASRGYMERDAVVVAAVELGGVRTLLGVPMLKEDRLVGAVMLYRKEVRPFTDKQIALVQNFAAQAVIAIENARLLNELRQRTDDLTESLEQQTATTEVLSVISASPTDLQRVFDTIVASAVRLCAARMGAVFRFDGNLIHLVAHHNYTPEVLEVLHRTHPRAPQPDQVSGRAILT